MLKVDDKMYEGMISSLTEEFALTWKDPSGKSGESSAKL
jgi:hypothetical protein